MTLMILLKNFMRVLLIILNDSNILFWNKFMNKKTIILLFNNIFLRFI